MSARVAGGTGVRRRLLRVASAAIVGLLGAWGGVFAGTFTAFGPQSYLRETGEPVTVITNFSIADPGAPYTIQIYNGGLVDGEFELVAHSVIKINGLDLVSPTEFNESIPYLEKPIPLNSNNALSVELHGQPGGGITIRIVGVDNTPPLITADASPQPNAAGWNRTDVTVTFTCQDATSGVASCSAPVTVSAEGEGQVVTGTATDNAGNTATASVTVNLDRTPPAITPAVAPPANAAGWHRTDVTVSYTCDDALSGVADCPAAVTVTTEGAGQTVAATVTDRAGNEAASTVSLDIDRTPPSLTITAPMGSVTGDATPEVAIQYTDALSGIEAATVAVRVDGALLTGCTVGPTAAMCPTTPLASGAHTIVASVYDVAGNNQTVAAGFSLILNRPPVLDAIGDRTAPLGQTLSLTVTGSDPDGDAVRFDVTPVPLPANATFDRTTGVFTFKPGSDQSGEHEITFSISDGILGDAETILLTVPAPTPGAAGTLQGRVLDANAAANGSTVPIVNATISLLGTFRTALSDAQGNFVVQNVPGGHQLLDIAVATAQPAPDGSLYAGFREAITLVAGVDNVVERPFYLPRIDMASRTTVDPGQTTVVTNPALGATLIVPPHTAKNPDGSDFVGELSISLVPKGLAPAPLPPNLDPGLLVTIQPVGVVFATPVPLTLANVDGVPANNDMNLWSLLASEGRFAVVGRGAVSADGQRIETTSGGVRAADWHAQTEPEPEPEAQVAQECDPSVCCCAMEQDASSATFREGALLEDFSLPPVRSLGVSRGLRLAYRSTTADLRPIVALDATLGVRSAVPRTFSASVSIGGVRQGAEVFYDTSTLPENDDSTSRLAVPIDVSGLPTGVYPFETRVFSHYAATSIGATSGGTLRVVNRRDSPVGAGWGIAGLQRLFVQPQGQVLLTEGDGTSMVFQPIAVGRFTGIAPMLSRRGDGAGLAPLQDGRVLVVGGTTTTTFDFASWTRTTEIYDPTTDTWAADSLTNGLRGGIMPVLHDGRILSAGSGTAETRDPETGQWTPTGAMVNTFNSHAITLLGNGRVLVTGGQGFAAAELFEAAANVWRPVLGSMGQQRSSHDATRLQDGRVLISGGEAFCGATPVATAEIFDPNAERFTPTGSMLTPRASHRGTLLEDGRILISGGAFLNSCGISGLLDSLELYDPATGTFTAVPGRLCSPKERHLSVLLEDGRVLIAGGYAPGPIGTTTACADVFDPVTNVVTPITPMQSARGAFFGLRLPGGRVMIAGGSSGSGQPTLNTAEMFQMIEEAGQFESPPGDFSTLSQHPDGSFTRTFKDGTRVEFSAAGLQTAVIDRNGNTTAFTHDGAGRLTAMTDPVGQVWTLSYATNGRLADITDPAGRVTGFTHDGDGNLVQVTLPDGNSIGYAYDAQHRLTRKTDERGKVSEHVYDAFGRLASVVLPTGETRTFVATQVRGAVDPAGGFGTPTNPAPITRSQDVQVSAADANGHGTSLTLNPFGAPAVQTDALGRVTRTTRGADNLPTEVIRPNGRRVTMTYDDRGNLLTSTEEDDPNGPATTTYTYEPVFNQVTSIADPLSHATTIGYDPRGNPTTITDALGKATTLTYDMRGLLTSSRDPLGNTATFTYDAKGNVETITDPRGKVTTLTRDPAGNVVTSRDPLGRVTQTAYDSMNRITQVTDPLNGVTRYAYDEAGNLTALTDANNHTTTFVYDDRNLLIETRNPLGQAKQYVYDPARNLDHVIDAKGQRIEFTYDAADELIRKVLKDATGAVTDTVNYGYDLLGNLTSAADNDSGLLFTYDPLGRLSTASTVAGPAHPATTITYAYDKAGNRTRMTDPHANVTTYVYDAVNRLTTLTSIDGAFTFGYDDTGRRTGLQFPNTTRASYAYDAASQLTALRYLDSALNLLSKFDYTYDDKGNRDSRTTLEGVTAYTYDPLDRLIGAVGPDPANPVQTATESYAYDAVGNRTSSHLATGQVHDAANRLLEDSEFTYTYDANGNLTSRQERVTSAVTTYEWDMEDRLIAVHTPAQTVTFRYDPLGRRIEKEGAATARYVYEQEDIVEELDGGNALSFRYVHGLGIDDALSKRILVTGQPTFFQVDGLGSIINTTNASGQVSPAYRYDSYGRVLAGTPDSGYAFTARERDGEANLYYYRARYYDPENGRFISEDPLGLAGGTNVYAYVRNRPVNAADPLGLEEYPDNFIGPLPPTGYYTHEMTQTTCGRIPPGPPGADVRQNMKDAASHADPYWFYNKVRNHGRWDYKQQDPKYQDFGNFNYGAAGRSLGFSLLILQRMAGYAQVIAGTSQLSWGDPGPFIGRYPLPWGGTPPYGDDPADQAWIQRGANYTERCGCQ